MIEKKSDEKHTLMCRKTEEVEQNPSVFSQRNGE